MDASVTSSRRAQCGWRRAPWIAGFSAIASIATSGAFAAERVSAHRYELQGDGILTLDAPVQRNGGLLLKAEFLPTEIVAVAPAQQSNGRFALSATLAASSLVCYSDTIFRNDFDADGF